MSDTVSELPPDAPEDACGHWVWENVPLPVVVTEGTVFATARWLTFTNCPIHLGDKQGYGEA